MFIIIGKIIMIYLLIGTIITLIGDWGMRIMEERADYSLTRNGWYLWIVLVILLWPVFGIGVIKGLKDQDNSFDKEQARNFIKDINELAED